jgi:predicted Zn finger-like uncharacterized protein
LTTRCPKCATPSAVAAGELGAAGRMIRCQRCGTNWLARQIAGDVYRTPPVIARKPSPRRDPLIIEGELVLTARPRFGPTKRYEAPPAVARRQAPPWPLQRGLVVLVVGLVLIAAISVTAPIVAALPGFSGIFARATRVAIEGLHSKAIRSGEAILVEGELVNRSEETAAVPAVRISLRTSGADEVYSWVVEPAVMSLAAGASVGFRSVLANPVPGAVHVAASLIDRAEATDTH